VATNELSVLRGPVDDGITVGEGEFSTCSYVRQQVSLRHRLKVARGSEALTFSGIPFQAVLVRDLSKAVLGDSGQGCVVQMVLVDFSAEVNLAFGLEFGVQFTSSSRASSRSGVVVASSSSWSWSWRPASRSSSTLRVPITRGALEDTPYDNVQDMIG
jgi:hypothetical protein